MIIINIYTPNTNAPRYLKQLLTVIEGVMDASTIIQGDLNTTLIPIHRSTTEVNRETTKLTQTINQMDLVDIYRIFHPMDTEYSFFDSAGTFSRINNMIGHKASLTKFKKIGIVPCTFSEHQGVKLEINNLKCPRKYINSWRLNNMLLNEQRVREKI